MKKLFLLLPGLSAIALTGCATYHITNQSLLEQFAGSGSETKVTILLAPPYLFFPGVVKGNDLRTITCLDKNDKEKVINVTNRTGVRITKKDGGKKTFYFNTLLLKDSTITGSKTHFFNAQIKPVKFSDISRIEIQK